MSAPGRLWSDEAMLKKLVETGEPFFVLRAQDALAAPLVSEWAKRAEGAGVPDRKVKNAFFTALAMRQWPKKKVPD